MPPDLAEPVGRRLGSRRPPGPTMWLRAVPARVRIIGSLVTVSALLLALFAVCCCTPAAAQVAAPVAEPAKAQIIAVISSTIRHADQSDGNVSAPSDDCTSVPAPLAPRPTVSDDMPAIGPASIDQPRDGAAAVTISSPTARPAPVPHLLCVMRT